MLSEASKTACSISSFLENADSLSNFGEKPFGRLGVSGVSVMLPVLLLFCAFLSLFGSSCDISTRSESQLSSLSLFEFGPSFDWSSDWLLLKSGLAGVLLIASDPVTEEEVVAEGVSVNGEKVLDSVLLSVFSLGK